MCRLFPTITFNYGSLQCGLVKGLAIRSLPPPPTHPRSLSPHSLLESGQAPCENDPNSPLLTLHAPRLTLREPAPTRILQQHSVNSHLSLLSSSLLHLPPPRHHPVSSSFLRLLLRWDLILFAVAGEFRGSGDKGYPEMMGGSLVVQDTPQQINTVGL